MNRDAKKVSITALTLISPRPSVTGSISLNTRATAGSRQSSTSWSWPSRPRSQGIGRNTWISVATRIAAAYT